MTAILQAVEFVSEGVVAARPAYAVPPMACGMAAGDFRQLKRRLTMIRENEADRRRAAGRTLGRAGLVEALRGAGGGYRFRGNARRDTLLDVVQLFEDVGPDPDADREASATGEGRALLRVMREIDDIARATLSSITIATMLKLVEQEQHAPSPGERPAARSSRAAK
jgi:hypothetical protein